MLGRGRSDAEGPVAVREAVGGGENGGRRERGSCTAHSVQERPVLSKELGVKLVFRSERQ